MRAVVLPHGRKAVLSDTVGFISDLPTSLIAAFRATLEEVIAADVILHVRDVSHAETEAQADDVDAFWPSSGSTRIDAAASSKSGTRPICSIPTSATCAAAQAQRHENCVLGSALKGEGLDALLGSSRSISAQQARCL